MPTRVRVVGGLGLVGALILVPATAGYAAGLGGITSSELYAQVSEPGVIGSMSDGFSTSANQDLDGRTLADGQVWSATPGDFEVSKKDDWVTATKSSFTPPLSIATLPWISIPTTRITSQITLQGAGMFGILMQADQATQTGVALRFLDTGNVEIARLHNGNWATLASATSSAIGTWSLTYDHGTYTATNGSTTLTYTATPSQDSAWRAFGDVGIFVAGPKAKDAAWSNFIVETP